MTPYNIHQLLTLHTSLSNDRDKGNFPTYWDDRIKHLGLKITTSPTDTEDYLYGKHTYPVLPAKKAYKALAAALLVYTTPITGQWFILGEENEQETNDEIKSWLNTCTQIILKELANSNFYSAIHEWYESRCSLGSAILHISTNGTNITCQNINIQNTAYSLDENEIPATLTRTFPLTPYQAARQFGLNNLPDKIQKEYNTPSAQHTAYSNYIEITYPNPQHNTNQISTSPTNRPYLCTYIHEHTKTILKTNGYYEFPYVISVHEKTHSEQMFGVAPCPNSLLYRYNYIDNLINTSCQTRAFPRVLELAEQVGEVDLRAGGITTVTQTAAQLGFPKEWATSADPSPLIALKEELTQHILDEYHYDMIQPILSMAKEKEMTATEVIAIRDEMFIPFAPSASRLFTSLTHLLKRTFGILYRLNKLPPPPDSIVENTNGIPTITPPNIKFTGKLALAIERLSAEGAIQSLNIAGQIINLTGSPDILDNIDLDTIYRTTVRNTGAPENILIPEIDRNNTRQLKQQQQLQLQQQNQQLTQSQLANQDAKTAQTLQQTGLL